MIALAKAIVAFIKCLVYAPAEEAAQAVVWVIIVYFAVKWTHKKLFK